MAALTAPYQARRKDGDLTRYPVAANTKVFKGGLAALSAAGYVQPGADAASITFAGVFAESVDNTTNAPQPGQIQPPVGSPNLNTLGGAAGAEFVRVEKEGAYVFSKAAAVQADVGRQCFISDDNTVSTTATTNNVFCGYVVELIDASHVRVRIDLAVH